jgi:hypothetical protein
VPDERDLKIARLERALFVRNDLVGTLTQKLNAAITANANIMKLLAKVVLSEEAVSMHIDGPCGLPPFHLTTQHQHAGGADGDQPQTDCRDYIGYHPGEPGDCQMCRQQGAAQADRRQPDPKRKTVPGRPWGLDKEDRN